MEQNDKDNLRKKIVGLGSKSYRKNYYSDLQKKIGELNLYISAIDQASDAVVIFQQKDGKIEYANRSFNSIFHKDKDIDPESLDIYMDAIEPLALWEQITGQIHSLSKNGKSCRVEIELQKKIKVFDTIINLLDYKKVSYVVVSLRDITESAEYERYIEQQNLELKRAKESAEESDKLKSAFISNISHEIRTPMNGIMGFSEMLLEGECGDEVRAIAGYIMSSANRLFGVINNLLEYSIITSKTINVKCNDVDPLEIAGDLKRQFIGVAERKNLEFNHEFPQNFNKLCYTDKTLVNKVFSILLDNAFKFTASGKVTYGCKLLHDQYVFFVRDTGSGIKPNEIDEIFVHFKKGSADISKFNEGTGLGLAIAKSLVEATGGWIKVESQLHSYTEFTFRMGTFIEKAEVNKAVPMPMEKKKSTNTILVAEDDALVFLYISSVLKGQEYNIIHAKNGLEATEYYSSNPHIDLILMDIKMPVMNGYEAAEIIRKQNSMVPIIAQSAYPVDLNKHTQFNDLISKPIVKSKLLNALNVYLS